MRIATYALMILIALGISGCGKRARFLDPPDQTNEKYPKHYPPTDSPGTHL